MKNKRISIITVCYNSERTIRDTIESVVNQDYDNLEYIIIDGLSTDGTKNIIKEYKERFPDKINYISEKDKGIFDAMNKGIRMSTGDIIGLLNSDDYYEDNTLQIVASHMKNEEDYVLYGMLRMLKDEKEFSCSINNFHFLPEQMIWHPACFVSAGVYKQYGLYENHCAADYEYFLKLFYSQKVKFYPIYEVLTNFRIGGCSWTYISFKEANRVKLKYKIINRRQYWYNSLKNWIRFKIIHQK